MDVSSRIVNVVDTDPPDITMLGDNPFNIEVDNVFNDPGVTAFDEYFGVISSAAIDICSNVNTLVDGSYTVIYTATDACGNSAIATRNVNVNPVQQLSNLIPTVVDYQIPLYYLTTISGLNFLQPSDYWNAYCVPSAFSSVMNYHNEVKGLNFQNNFTSQNSTLTQTDYMYNYIGRISTSTNTGVTDPMKIDIGYMLNTNAHGHDISDGSHVGTRLGDFSKFPDFMTAIAPGISYEYYYKGFNNDVSFNKSGNPINDYSSNEITVAYNDIKTEIDAQRPVILSFNHWNILEIGQLTVNTDMVTLYEFGAYTPTPDAGNPIYQSDPDYISEQWNNENNENNLGHTVTCVGYVQNHNGKNWVIVQDNVNLPTDPNKTPRFVGVPFDALNTWLMSTFIDFSGQSAQSQSMVCLHADSSVNIINSSGNKYVFNNGSIYDADLSYGLANGTYKIRNVPEEHPIAFLNNDVSNLISYSGTVPMVEIEVTGGTSTGFPWFTFSPNINDPTFKFIPGHNYRFKTGPNGISSSHPFYVSDSGYEQPSTEIVYLSSSSPGHNETTGIFGNGKNIDIHIPVNFTKSLTYYCTNHPTMQHDISVSQTLVNGINYNYYYGDVSVNVSGDFGTISANCFNHGYMGTENKFTYTNTCNYIQATFGISTNINTYEESNPNTLPNGILSSLRVYDINNTEELQYILPQNLIVNKVNELEDSSSNVAVYVFNDNVYIQCASGNLYNGAPITIVAFNVYDNSNQLHPITEVSFDLDGLVDSKYTIQEEGPETFFIMQSNSSNYSNASLFTTLSTEPVLLGTLSK